MSDVNKLLQGRNLCIVDLYFHLKKCRVLLPKLEEKMKKGDFTRFNRCNQMILDETYVPKAAFAQSEMQFSQCPP